MSEPSSRSLEMTRDALDGGEWLMGETIRRVARALDAVRAEEREKVAAFMLARSIATGHGDTIEDLLSELYHGAIEIGRKREERTSAR